MAPIPNPSASTGTAPDNFEDSFSSSLLSNLAPLVSLVGDQVIKQSFSHITGWIESISFAMTPTGILSTVVSTIRLGGNSWLKAIVGRGRESMATAEKELLSTTSRSVCEMWTGTGIVRMSGQNMTREFFFRPVKDPTSTEPGTTYVRDFCSQLERPDRVEIDDNGLKASFYEHRALSNMAPNLTVNGPKFDRRPYFLVIISVAFQVAIILAAGLVTFRFGLLKTTRPFLLLLHLLSSQQAGSLELLVTAHLIVSIGSFLIVIGILGCSRIVDHLVTRHHVIFSDPKLDIVRIQKLMRVGDEKFLSFIIPNAPGDHGILLWRLWARPWFPLFGQVATFSVAMLTAISSGITVVGFVAQFIGMLGLHYSVSVAVTAATLLMLMSRALASARLAQEMNPVKLVEGRELDSLTIHFICSMDTWTVYSGYLRNSLPKLDGLSIATSKPSELPRIALEVRGQAQRLLFNSDLQPIPWPNDYDDLSQKINSTFRDMWRIIGDLNGFEGFHLKPYTRLSCNLDVIFENPPPTSTLGFGKVRFLLGDNGDVKKDDLSAALSLWSYTAYVTLTSIYLVGIFKDKADYRSRSQGLLRGWCGKQEQRSFRSLKFSKDRISFLPHARTEHPELFDDTCVLGIRNIAPLTTEYDFAVGFVCNEKMWDSKGHKLMALEIIHNWLSDIAPYIDRIDLETARITDDLNGDPILVCDPVDDLCHCLDQSGLFDCPEVTRKIVISVLIKHALLPIPEDLRIPEDSDSEDSDSEDSDPEHEEQFPEDLIVSEPSSFVDSTSPREETAQANEDETTNHREPVQAHAEEATDYPASENEEVLSEDPMDPEYPSSIDSTSRRDGAAQVDEDETTDHEEPVQTDEEATDRQHLNIAPSFPPLRTFLFTTVSGVVTVVSNSYLGVRSLIPMAPRALQSDSAEGPDAEEHELPEREGNINPSSSNDPPAGSQTNH